MKQTTSRIVILLLLIISAHASFAGSTFTVSSASESWATLMVPNGSTTCSGCTIIIPAGDQLNLSSGECDGCKFEQSTSPTGLGGTLNISSSFTLTNGGAATTLDNITVIIGTSTTFYNITANDDSFHINANLTISNGAATIGNSSFDINGVTFSTQGMVVSNSNFAMSTGSSWTNGGTTFLASNLNIWSNGSTFQTGATTATISNSNVTLTGASQFNPNNALSFSGNLTMSNTSTLTTGSSSSFSNGTITLNNTASINTKAATLSAENTYLNNNSSFSDNPLTLENGSYFQVGDGSSTSGAYLNSQNQLVIDDNSLLSLQNYNNYFQTSVTTWSGGTYPTTDNCGTPAHPNSCKSDGVWGCATFTKTTFATCTPLALAAMNLTAATSGAHTVALTWTDAESSTADHYLVQRSLDNDSWTNIAAIDAGGYTNGDYHYEDAAAAAGTDNYRIARVAKDGSTLYTSISSVTLAAAAGALNIYPNPVTGHAFFITSPDMAQMAVSVFTMTGQLLSRQTLQGQVQYQVALPAQLLPGTAVVVQVTGPTGTQAFTLLLR